MGTIPALTQGIIDSMLVGVGAELDKCAEKVVDQLLGYRKYVLRWAIDPYQGQKVFHYYGIAMRGLAEGERVSIVEANGRVLQTAFGREGQPMMLDALMDPLSYDGLELLPEKASALDQIREAFSDGGKKSLDVTGQLIVTRSQISVPAATTQISAMFFTNRPMLFIRTPSQILGYDLSNPAIPRQLSSQSSSVNTETDGPARSQVRSRGQLFVVKDNQIQQYDLIDPRKPVLVQSHEMAGVRQILAPPVSQGTSLLVRFQSGKDRLYQFAKDRAPEVAIEYHAAPWWLSTVSFNSLLLRWDKTTSLVSINEYGVTKPL